MATAKLSSKSQIVLPAKLRRKLGIKPGDLLEITAENETILLRKAPGSSVQELERCGSDIWRGYEKELKGARDEWDR
jgi:AbrB family looped-hinge helix DNA binding protein